MCTHSLLIIQCIILWQRKTFLIELGPRWKASNSRAKYLDRERKERGQTCIDELQRMRDKQRMLLNLTYNYRLVPFTCSDFPLSLNIPQILFPLSQILRLTLFYFFPNLFCLFVLPFSDLCFLFHSRPLSISVSLGLGVNVRKIGQANAKGALLHLSLFHTHTHTHHTHTHTHTPVQ